MSPLLEVNLFTVFFSWVALTTSGGPTGLFIALLLQPLGVSVRVLGQ